MLHSVNRQTEIIISRVHAPNKTKKNHIYVYGNQKGRRRRRKKKTKLKNTSNSQFPRCCCWPDPFPLSKIIIALISFSPFGENCKQNKNTLCIGSTRSWQIKGTAVLYCRNPASCFGSVITSLKCACWLIGRLSVPRRLKAVRDWWHANENRNLSSSLTHRLSFCLSSSFTGWWMCALSIRLGLECQLTLLACPCEGRPPFQPGSVKTMNENEVHSMSSSAEPPQTAQSKSRRKRINKRYWRDMQKWSKTSKRKLKEVCRTTHTELVLQWIYPSKQLKSRKGSCSHSHKCTQTACACTDSFFVPDLLYRETKAHTAKTHTHGTGTQRRFEELHVSN